MQNHKIVIFTDLDGTLLDYDNYSFKEALPSLRQLKKKNIPIIICSSKTRKEIEVFINKLKISHPFVAENGGAIFIPRGYFSKWNYYSMELNNYQVIELGTSYEILREKLEEVRKSLGIELKGFGDMSTAEIEKETGLKKNAAKLSKEREYDEPFKFTGCIPKKKISEMRKEFEKNKLKLTRGGRYFHLTGNNDKGKAVKILKRLYKLEFGKEFFSIGIGDSINDLPMLNACDEAVIVKKANGSYDGEILEKLSQKIILANGIGPKGWRKAILNLLSGKIKLK